MVLRCSSSSSNFYAFIININVISPNRSCRGPSQVKLRSVITTDINDIFYVSTVKALGNRILSRLILILFVLRPIFRIICILLYHRFYLNHLLFGWLVKTKIFSNYFKANYYKGICLNFLVLYNLT